MRHGFGLSYTTFEYTPAKVEKTADETFEVSCIVTNTDSVDAFEVPQLYTHQRYGSLVRPIAELKGYQKLFIPAGETRTVTFTLTSEQLGYWHEEHNDLNSRVWFATDSAEFDVWIAPDSRRQTPPASFSLQKSM